MKEPLPLLALFFLVACGGSPDQPVPGAPNPDEPQPATAAPPPFDTASAGAAPESPLMSANNTVADYASHLLGTEIAASSDEMDPGNGDAHYFDILDVKNGFARVAGFYEGNHDFAVWKMDNGNDLVGHTTTSCGPVCNYSFSFYEVREGLMMNVTGTVLPMNEILSHEKKISLKVMEEFELEDNGAQLKFILPREGTSLLVFISMNDNELEFVIAELGWDKETFSVRNLYDAIPTFH